MSEDVFVHTIVCVCLILVGMVCVLPIKMVAKTAPASELSEVQSFRVFDERSLVVVFEDTENKGTLIWIE